MTSEGIFALKSLKIIGLCIGDRAVFNVSMLSNLIITINVSDFIILYMCVYAFGYMFQPPVVILRALKYVKLNFHSCTVHLDIIKVFFFLFSPTDALYVCLGVR
jgi:hypothetical protein